MMQNIISNSYKNAKRIKLNCDSKFIFFSDCHRGDNSYADDFANNSNIYFHALRSYLENDYSYIEESMIHGSDGQKPNYKIFASKSVLL